MPIAVPKNYHYAYVPETKEELDWADLPTVDFAKWDEPGGKEELARQLLDAVNTKGFFYLINFGVSPERVSRQFGIGSEFYASPLEERMKSISDIEHGNSNGYRPMGRRVIGQGLKDRVEEYNVPGEFSPAALTPVQPDPNLTHPPAIQEALPEITEFQQDLVNGILARLYELIAIGLQVPPESLKEIWDIKGGATGILRYMRYSPFTEEELPKLNRQLYGGGHTDSCAITLLFRQPIAALQIKDPQSGVWKWAKPMDNSLTVNAGDVLSILTGGYIRSTIHRVNIPPKDQRKFERLGVIYFSRPPKHMMLHTIDSPVLKAAGCDQNAFEKGGHEVPNAGGEHVPDRADADFQIRKELWQKGGKSGDVILPGFQGLGYD